MKKIIYFLCITSLIAFLGCAGLKPDPRYNSNRRSAPSGKKNASKDAKKKSQSKANAEKKKSTKQKYSRDRLDKEVQSWEGTPYAWGRSGKGSGVDCSAYTQSVMKKVYGINLPRTSAQQYNTGKFVKKNSLRRGDLVFFNTTGKGVSHVGIYLGHGRFTHSSNSDGVTINKLTDSYYRKRYLGARRVIGR